jgi:hypothetical protein
MNVCGSHERRRCEFRRLSAARAPDLLQDRTNTPIKNARHDRRGQDKAIAGRKRILDDRARRLGDDQDGRRACGVEWISRENSAETRGVDNAKVDRRTLDQFSRFIGRAYGEQFEHSEVGQGLADASPAISVGVKDGYPGSCEDPHRFLPPQRRWKLRYRRPAIPGGQAPHEVVM